MKEDIDYDAHTIKGPKRARWYTCLWPACLGRGCLSSKRQEFPLYSIGYDPVGQLQRAASVGDVASVGRLIKFYGFHVNQCDSRHRTSLHYACAHNHPDVVRLLLSYNANIDVLDDEGCTPLIKAAQRDNVECVSILLTQDADPHVMDFSGNTALHHAVSRGNTAIASNLLECNADIDGKTEYGLTPYKLALFENQHQMAEFLMQNGANAHSVVQSKSVGTSPKDQEQRKKEHETFNNEAHYSADLLPFCSRVTPPTQLKSILKKSAHLTTVSGRIKHKISLCVGTSSKKQEQRKKKHIRFNNVLEVRHCTDLMPFCRLSDEPKTLESMREDKESPSVTKETQKQIPHTDKMDRKKKGMRSWTSETNLCAQGDAIPNRTEKKTFLMDEEKKTEPFPNTPDDHGIAVPPPTAHIGPTSSLGTGDRGETIGAPKKQDFGAVHDLKLRLGMPLLLLTSLVWLLKFIISMVTWILQQIQQVLEKEDYPGAPRKQKGDRVADD
ncbi:ankyrin repeat, SAM and basic leucine zipper domain-containing protein 1-like isoform X2 [Mesocricetus auratus]|uniref:Ankyrin repeat, SAM and basic leucine zipper domain-containing protein 1-like isoform X2 n=1 Tax=Mesocricetus auratus TaxID=10036 RepID=A0ABM2W9Q2_MESAU|nr:ankyrin repeat, SAM and basic leucine zipper domain-containing protein 1-like isoform X2 [Mesocricetus auratus]